MYALFMIIQFYTLSVTLLNDMKFYKKPGRIYRQKQIKDIHATQVRDHE